MLKRFVIYLCSFMVFFFMVPERGYATTQQIVTSADLKICGIESNEAVANAIEIL